MILNSPYITGSITVTGNANVQGTLTVTGSLSGTATSASLALNSNLLQGTGSVGFSTTASLLEVSSSQQQISASLLNVIANYATTGSNSFRANQSITGSLVVSSTITAQTLVVQTVTSSIVYSSGSNLFGNSLSNTQTFTGSVNITGSLALAGNITGNAITLTGALGGTSATFSGNLNLQGAVTRNINFYDSSNTNINAQIQYDQIASNSGQLFFGTNNAGTFATRLTISNTGAATFSSSVTAGGSSLFNAGSGTLSADILTVRGGGGTGAYGFKIEANNGEDIFYTDNYTYNIIANPVSGKFGIGTTGPSTLLHINTTARTSGTNVNMITLSDTVTGVQTSGYGVRIVGTSNNGSAVSAIAFEADGGTNNDTAIAFYTQSTAGALTRRVTINRGGQLRITQAANGHSGDGLSLINTANEIWNFVNGGDSNLYFGFQGNSKGVFAYTTGVYTALSDKNKKKDFEESTIGLSAILGLKPTLYRMKEEDESTEKHLGFIAQEVKEFIPQAYIEQIDGERTFIGLQDRPIISVLVKAIQELKATNDDLQAQINELKER